MKCVRYVVKQWEGGGWGYTESCGKGGLTTCYPNREDAELWCDRLNRAYELGRKHGRKEAVKMQKKK